MRVELKPLASQVMVITGADKGKTGRVLEVLPAAGKILVEGVNVRKRAWRRGVNPNLPDGGIHEKSLPIDASNVMVLDPETGNPTGIGIRYEIDADGNRRRIRFAKKSGKEIPEQF